MKTPKVSVLTPVYNTNPQYLKECIESILNQTFTDFEFVILNDSPENAEIEKIVKSYDDPRIKYYKNEKNTGISASRNKLLDLARGEYVAVFDHDDISKPDRLEKEVKYLDENPDVGVVSSNIHRFPEDTVSDHPTENLEIKQWLMCAMVVAHTAIMLRKSVLDKHGVRYEEAFSPAEDYRLVLRLMEHTMFHNLKEVLVDYRNVEKNTSHLQRDKMENADALCKDYAARTYPYLYNLQMTGRPLTTPKYWIRLFDLIPLFRVKVKPRKTCYYLFGFIPLLAVRR